MSRQPPPDYASFQARLKRRSISVSALLVVAIVATMSAPIWIAVALVIDAVRLRWRFPLTRLLLFGWFWSIIECAGVFISFVLWMSGQSNNRVLHYRLMGWWAGKLMTGLRIAMRASIDVDDTDAFHEGNAVVLCRHASLADSLVSAWVICTNRGLSPRYVLKRELLWDPCLDIVGLRVPNYFVDRGSHQSTNELAAVTRLSTDLAISDVAVIFPEGTRSSDAKRKRALDKIRDQSPERLAATKGLRHLIPVRPSGTLALLEGAPYADLVIVWHTGFDGLSTFGGVIAALGRSDVQIVFRARRLQRSSLPDVNVAWLDDIWAKIDSEVDEQLRKTS